jgi:hypothetical protein
MTTNAPARFHWRASLHTVFALLFVLAGAFHLWFNWPPGGSRRSADSPMKDVAERHGQHPHDLVEILAGV